MDRYTEQILKKKPDGKQKLMLIGSIVIIAIGVYAMMFIHFSIGVAVTAIGGFLTYLAKLALDAEYEYLFINGDCDIARITNKSARKDIYSFKASDVQRILTYNSNKCQNEFQVNGELSIKSFTSGIKDNDNNWYVFFANAKSGTVAIILELNDKSIEHITDCYKNKIED